MKINYHFLVLRSGKYETTMDDPEGKYLWQLWRELEDEVSIAVAGVMTNRVRVFCNSDYVQLYRTIF